MSTLFTRIIEGELPGHFVWDDGTCVAFASIEPVAPGHLLLVPRQEAPSYWEADPEVVAHMARVAQIISRAQLRAFPVARVGQIVAGFDVPHLHVHLIPLSDQGQLDLARAHQADAAELALSCQRVRTALREMGQDANIRR